MEKYLKMPDDGVYRSWVQLEAEAMKFIIALNEYSSSFVICDGESVADNVLYLNTGYADNSCQ